MSFYLRWPTGEGVAACAFVCVDATCARVRTEDCQAIRRHVNSLRTNHCLEHGCADSEHDRRLAEKKPIGGVVRFDCVFVPQAFKKRSKGREIVLFDLEAREHAPEV